MQVTGVPATNMGQFDKVITDFLHAHNVPGAAVAVARNGSVIIARGYGLLDKDDAGSAVNPANIYRIASVSKPITAVAILKLIQDGRLKMTSRVYTLLKSSYPLLSGKSLTPGIEKITVQHLLRHEGGWDRDSTNYDPMFDSVQIASAVGVTPPASAGDIIRHMWSQPLQFQPGTKSVYSNFGYCLLGRVIERVTGRPYGEYVQNEIFGPMGITGIVLGRSRMSGQHWVKRPTPMRRSPHRSSRPMVRSRLRTAGSASRRWTPMAAGWPPPSVWWSLSAPWRTTPCSARRRSP